MTPPRMAHSISDTISPFLSFVSPGYSDEKVARLTKESVQAGVNHFKIKVGVDLKDDLRRGKLIRSIIDDPQWQRQRAPPPDDPELASAGLLSAGDDPALARKNAGPTGVVLMIDANQVWDMQQAIDYVSSLAEIKPWCVSLHSILGAEGSARGFVLRNESLLTISACVRARPGSLRSRRRQTISLDTRPSVAR
jgi:hypothetical protein